MNTLVKIICIAVCGTAVTCSALAESTNAEASAAQKISNYIDGNLFGIQSVKKDAENRIVSLVVIGRAPVSSAQTKARAKSQAFRKADAVARAEFMKWLTTAVTYTRIDQDDIAIVQRGESLGDAGDGHASESAEASEFSQEQVVSVAHGFVKGLVQIGAGISADDEAVVILGWNANTAEQADRVRAANVPGAPKAEPAVEKKLPRGGAVGKPNPSASVSDDAKDFL